MAGWEDDVNDQAAALPGVTRALHRLRAALPEGRQLPEDVWLRRHSGVLVLLWVHAAAVPLYALVSGFSPLHALAEAAILPSTATLATAATLSRRARTVVASLGLLSASAILVHISGGLIEMHFHFFVMVAVVALYQDWLPFLMAIGYVLVHHGVMGAIAPESVFNHPAARAHPWLWAGIHALFIAGISAACLVTWRLNERMLEERLDAEGRLLEQSRLTESLYEVGQVLSADLDTERVVQAVTDAATELTAAGFGAFFYNVADEHGESYMLYTLSGAPKEAFAGFGLPRNTPVFAPTFAGEGVMRVDDITKDPRYGTMGPHHGMPQGHLPVRSYLAVPVRSRTGEVLGGLFFGHAEPGRFTEIEEQIVGGIAAQATVALDNARLYDLEREARAAAEAASERLALLADASRILTSSLEVEAILAALGALVTPLMADYCVIDLLEDGDALRRLMVGGAPPEGGGRQGARLEPPPADDPDHPVRRALATGTTQLVAADHAPVPFAIVVPMVGRGAVLGTLTLGVHPHTNRLLRPDDRPFAEELGRRAASAIENARLYARQRTVAETLQHSLLPDRLPAIPGIATAARYAAGGPGVEVGGDWYDVLQLPTGHLLLAIGDVVGRGERAASLMGQLRNAVRAYAIDGKGPAEVVERLNLLSLELGPDHMATMLLALLDPETGEVRYANAGHPPPLLTHDDGSASFLESGGGLPVGAFVGARYEDRVTLLAPGDTLVLYTDGLVEDRSAPIEQGLARLRQAATTGPSDDLDDVCAHIMRSALGERDAHDDAAVLAVRLLPLGDRIALRLPSEPSILAPLRALLRRWLTDAGATEEESYELLVACGEACTNAIRHGAGATAAEFEVDAELNGDVRVTVRDGGQWREPRAGVGGRGLSIIDHYVDAVEVVKGPAGTEVRMRRQIGPNLRAEAGR